MDQTRATAPPRIDHLPLATSEKAPPLSEVASGVDRTTLDLLAGSIHEPPPGFNVHPKLARQLQQRAELYHAGKVEWALAEALAFASVLKDGYDVRLAGQDTRRGTFSQRHSVLFDYETGVEYTPLANLRQSSGAELDERQAGRFMVYDSLLSEFAALGFEYGYSVESPEALVAWEAQFGDFANGAQVVIDNFLASAGEKWGQSSALTLLLPHGYEGQGPEHSSARLERFLTICAGDNLTVAQPTTAAQYFHLLRAQTHRSTRRPLVVMTPKSLLRARQARSPVAEFVEGGWREVLDDGEAARPGSAAWCFAAARSPTTPWRAGTSSGRRRASRSPSSASSSSTRGPHDKSQRCWRVTPKRARSSGSKKNQRTWGPGRSRTVACTPSWAHDTS